MNKMQKMVKDFHKKYKHTTKDKPELLSNELCKFREDLIQEEFDELKNGFENRDLVEIADALGDLLYVVFGTSCSLGIDIEPVFNEIHRSNMSKDYSGSNCRKHIKGPNYFKPNILKEIDKQRNK